MSRNSPFGIGRVENDVDLHANAVPHPTGIEPNRQVYDLEWEKAVPW